MLSLIVVLNLPLSSVVRFAYACPSTFISTCAPVNARLFSSSSTPLIVASCPDLTGVVTFTVIVVFCLVTAISSVAELFLYSLFSRYSTVTCIVVFVLIGMFVVVPLTGTVIVSVGVVTFSVPLVTALLSLSVTATFILILSTLLFSTVIVVVVGFLSTLNSSVLLVLPVILVFPVKVAFTGNFPAVLVMFSSLYSPLFIVVLYSVPLIVTVTLPVVTILPLLSVTVP